MRYVPPAGAADLPQLARALDPAAMLEAFARYLPPRDGTLWSRCAIARVSYKPAHSARVLYQLWKQGEPAGEPGAHHFYCEFLPAARSLQRYEEKSARSGTGRPTGFVAELDMVYWRFPADPRLVQLAGIWREGDWKVLGYVPTMSCVLSGTRGGEPRIVKLYHDDRAESAGAVMRGLAAAGVPVPRILEVDTERRALVFEHVPGVAFWSDPAAHLRREVMAAMARQLVALHGTELHAPLVLEDVAHGAREWAYFQDARGDLVASFPDLQPRFERLATMLGLPLEPPEASVTHGDFHPQQFLVEGGVPRLIDFDNVCRGDPMYDLARFASHLYYKGWMHERPLREIEAAVSAFRSAYVGAGSRFAANRWFWHLAVSLVAMRAHRVLTRLESGGEACVKHLVTLAEQNAASIVRH